MRSPTYRAAPVLAGLVALAVVCAAARFAPARAQSAAAVEEAEERFAAGDWETAAAAWESVLESDPDNAHAWYRLAACLHQLQQYDRATAAYERARELGVESLELFASGAVAYARLGDVDKALAWLGEAVDRGLTDNVLHRHPGLGAVRSDPRFEALVARAEGNRPCARPEHALLDFWVGEWHVLDAGGNHAGDNVIEKALDGCLILESWASRAGTRGHSSNYFDPASRRWRQVWVDDGGGVITAEGRPEEGGMLFEGLHVEGDGRQELFRMTLRPRPEGGVEQIIEQSADAGATWYLWFSGTYVARKR